MSAAARTDNAAMHVAPSAQVIPLFSKRKRLAQDICAQRASLMATAMFFCNSNRADAEDLVQETLLRALDRIETLRDESRLKPWTKAILMNLVRDRFRRKDVTEEIGADLPSQMDSPERLTERSELFGDTRSAIENLSPRLRQVVGLVCIAELSYAEAAEVIDVPIGTIMSRLSRARKALQPVLARHPGVSGGMGDHRMPAPVWSWEGVLPFSEMRSAFC
jgi:RNA polymerase sigma-70 factor (ECF subfamily)